jgi:hypothetical protein
VLVCKAATRTPNPGDPDPKPRTPNPESLIPNSKSPKPQTRNPKPKPKTRNSKPETSKPQGHGRSLVSCFHPRCFSSLSCFDLSPSRSHSLSLPPLHRTRYWLLSKPVKTGFDRTPSSLNRRAFRRRDIETRRFRNIEKSVRHR